MIDIANVNQLHAALRRDPEKGPADSGCRTCLVLGPLIPNPDRPGFGYKARRT